MTVSKYEDTPFLKEGLFLFFPAAAILAVLTPVIWIILFGQVHPFAKEILPQHWHAHEMIFGVYGAALAGFLTSAVPEWTDTTPKRGKELIVLLALWLPGRLIGLFGMDSALILAAATDVGFFLLLLWYIAKPMIDKRNGRHLSFVVWVGCFALAEAAIRWAWWNEDTVLSSRMLHVALMIFVVFLSLSLSRITVVVVNHALDPSGETTPYRPHPGRRNMAVGLVVLYGFSAFFFPESQVRAYLALAAAAAFFDRLAEWFIGWPVLRAEVLSLGGANAAAGVGFMLIGASGLGLPVAETTGMHVLSVLCLGLAIFGVFTIAGLRHSGRELDLPWHSPAAMLLVIGAGLVRVIPELPFVDFQLGVSHYAISALLWTGAFAVWLIGFVPLLGNPVREEASDPV